MKRKRPVSSGDNRALGHSFQVDDEDHCETPAAAYDDIAPVLRWLAARKGVEPGGMAVYDPYFCAGAVVRNLGSRGFTNVYNRNEDFYAKIASNSTPAFDALVTNPPYSDDHIEKMLRFCVNSGKPWMALVPNFVYTHEYYGPVLEGASRKPFYVVPTQRYTYYVPGGVRSKREVKTSPFMSFWYCDLQEHTAPFIKWWRKTQARGATSEIPAGTNLVGHTSKLPHRMRAQYDTSRKRLRKKQRTVIERRRQEKRAAHRRGGR